MTFQQLGKLSFDQKSHNATAWDWVEMIELNLQQGHWLATRCDDYQGAALIWVFEERLYRHVPSLLVDMLGSPITRTPSMTVAAKVADVLVWQFLQESVAPVLGARLAESSRLGHVLPDIRLRFEWTREEPVLTGRSHAFLLTQSNTYGVEALTPEPN